MLSCREMFVIKFSSDDQTMIIRSRVWKPLSKEWKDKRSVSFCVCKGKGQIRGSFWNQLSRLKGVDMRWQPLGFSSENRAFRTLVLLDPVLSKCWKHFLGSEDATKILQQHYGQGGGLIWNWRFFTNGGGKMSTIMGPLMIMIRVLVRLRVPLWPRTVFVNSLELPNLARNSCRPWKSFLVMRGLIIKRSCFFFIHAFITIQW